MQQTESLKPKLGKPPTPAKEWKLVSLRDCPLPESLQRCETPQQAADYWRTHVPATQHYDPERECFVVLFLNTRRRVRGHQFLTIGTLDTLLVHPREVFRLAIVAASAAIVLMHNHPSGDPTPSDADIKVTRDLIKAGQLLKVEVLDHVIVGHERHVSLRELGYFYS
jgi:DNA repair protein RadC